MCLGSSSRLRTAGSVAAFCLLLGACASLLDIPEDPQLAATESAPALPSPSGAAGASGSPLAAAGDGLSPSPGSEVDGSGATIIAEQTRPSPPAAPDAPVAAGPDAGTGSPLPEQPSPEQPLPEQPLPEQPLPEQPVPEPPVGSGGASGQEPPPEPSPCGDGRSLGPNGRCFTLVSTALPWPEARESCEDLGQGWDLAVARNAELNAFLSTLIIDEAWLGGTDQNVEGVWRWVDDNSVFWQGDEAGAAPDGAYANWNPTEPNGGGNSDCLRLVARVGNEWADLECELPRSALCEGPLP